MFGSVTSLFLEFGGPSKFQVPKNSLDYDIFHNIIHALGALVPHYQASAPLGKFIHKKMLTTLGKWPYLAQY